MYGVALSAAIAVLVMMLAAITLLPALLSYLGPSVDRLRIPVPRAIAAEGGGDAPGVARPALGPRRPEAPLARRHLGDGGAARARGAGPRHAPRLPRRRQRSARLHDPAGLRPDRRGLRPGTNGPVVVAAKLSSRFAEAGDGQPREPDPRRFGCGVRLAPVRVNSAGDAALIPVVPKSSPQDQATSDLVKRLRDDTVPTAVGSSGIDVKIGGVTAALEDQSTVHDESPAALHRGSGRPLLPASAGRVPLAVHLAEGGRDEPALGLRRVRRHDPCRQGWWLQQPDRHRPRGPESPPSCP